MGIGGEAMGFSTGAAAGVESGLGEEGDGGVTRERVTTVPGEEEIISSEISVLLTVSQ